MEEADRLRARSIDAARAWMRAACAVHEQERRLRDCIGEVHRLADALVLRMQLMGQGRMRDGVLSYAIQLRDRLAAEARKPPLLHRWQESFDRLAREREALDPYLDALLERDLDDSGLPEEPSHQLCLHFATPGAALADAPIPQASG
jgi:hypothetical protein